MTVELPECIEINPACAPRASILWLHGLGADGNDFAPLIPQLGIVDTLGVRVVLPHAPHQPVGINNGMVMRAWYDITATDFRVTEDAAGIRASEALLGALMEREMERGIPAEHILLAGFSQGGAIALHTGLRYPQRLAGILVLSAYLPLAASLAAERAAANAGIPILQAHGTHDPLVPLVWAMQSRDYLEELGYRIDWREYPMQHAMCPQEVEDIRNWIVNVLGTV
ncbi:MAG: alpha/beta fold hydrolase [Gammaproteobacteria bacterium]|nr:MAG: alpha/beta fold hydrolase [Gammaproteobacteria bacterium]